ncbi:MAG: hypothetical protein IPP49_08365 [Saprospiraceae bacterium]|nr:hypothetical protein [Saprospiraceae bacterium]
MKSFNKAELLEEVKDWHQMLKKYQVPDTKKAVIQLINSYGIFIAIWILQFYLFESSVLWVIGLAIFNGFLLGRIFIIQHDCGHKSFLHNRSANDIIGIISSFFGDLFTWQFIIGLHFSKRVFLPR